MAPSRQAELGEILEDAHDHLAGARCHARTMEFLFQQMKGACGAWRGAEKLAGKGKGNVCMRDQWSRLERGLEAGDRMIRRHARRLSLRSIVRAADVVAEVEGICGELLSLGSELVGDEAAGAVIRTVVEPWRAAEDRVFQYHYLSYIVEQARGAGGLGREDRAAWEEARSERGTPMEAVPLLGDDEELELGDEIVSRCGGVCRVRRGRWHRLDVVVKDYNDEQGLGLSHEALAALFTDLEIQRSMDLSRVVGVLAARRSGVVVMEMARCGLDELVAEQPDLSLAERGRLLLGAASALDHMHARGVAHRNVKSSNFLVFGTSVADFVVKASDMGLTAPKAELRFRRTGQPFETCAWAAPEVRGGGPPGTRSDVFGFGVVMFEVISRAPPYAGAGSENEVLAMKKRGADPCTLPPECPGRLGEVMRRCLARDPAQRPIMKEVMVELKRLSMKQASTPAASKRASRFQLKQQELRRDSATSDSIGSAASSMIHAGRSMWSQGSDTEFFMSAVEEHAAYADGLSQGSWPPPESEASHGSSTDVDELCTNSEIPHSEINRIIGMDGSDDFGNGCDGHGPEDEVRQSPQQPHMEEEDDDYDCDLPVSSNILLESVEMGVMLSREESFEDQEPQEASTEWTSLAKQILVRVAAAGGRSAAAAMRLVSRRWCTALDEGVTSIEVPQAAYASLDPGWVPRLAKFPNLAGLKLPAITDLAGAAGGAASASSFLLSPSGLAPLSNLLSIDFGTSEIDDWHLENLEGLSRLTSLDIAHSRVTHAGLRSLSAFCALEDLNLADTLIGDGGVEHIARLTSLTSLDLGFSNVRYRGVCDLSSLTNLRSLGLGGIDLCGRRVAPVAKLTSLTSLSLVRVFTFDDYGAKVLAASNTALESLNLALTRVGDEGAGDLAGLTRLRVLDLRGTGVGDRGTAALKALSRLRSLHLGDTAVGDGSLGHLACMSRLEKLIVAGSRMSPGAARTALRRLPRLRLLGLG